MNMLVPVRFSIRQTLAYTEDGDSCYLRSVTSRHLSKIWKLRRLSLVSSTSKSLPRW